MGNLVWHEYARLISITASAYAVWSSFFALFYRKFFWDFIGGTLRDPGGLQPAPSAAIFITLIVKAPIIPIINAVIALFILSVENPLPALKSLSIRRSLIFKVVLLVFQTFLSILYYQKAQAEGDLLFFPSTIVKHSDAGIENKPALPTPNFTPSEKKAFDPFEPPYNQNLYVGELRDEDNAEDYVVLLNKYSVVARHFLLVTKEFRSQASPLSPPDLVQTYLLLAAARKSRHNLFAFYNCGDNSGASQSHKHVQFIPLEDEDGPPIEYLARSVKLETPDTPFALNSLAYANHVYRFPDRMYSFSAEKLEAVLAQAFLGLLDLVISTIRHDPDYPAGKPSYNVVITLEHMHLIPRRREVHVLSETGDKLSVNALAFAGMMLVKSERELAAVQTEGVGKILRAVGLESVHELQVQGTAAEARDIET
ncbi:ATP adenylyltransferase-domain-containing protein [Mycena albidolilacea]|uniref:ATP adenylyltransferase-domain-containing protein n=1 Tax=Mycena albidolilacea TaxID=1033008 RepID=A0AAD7A171_9AGAR|nr:ATP adenylyltransferase-domain-containing protein [Mycena albidolilacea]